MTSSDATSDITTDATTDTPERILLPDDYHPYLYPVPRSFVPDLLATDAEKWLILAGLGITPELHPDRTPLQAWRDAVADASGLPRASLDPRQGGALDLGFSPSHVRSFVMFLA